MSRARATTYRARTGRRSYARESATSKELAMLASGASSVVVLKSACSNDAVGAQWATRIERFCTHGHVAHGVIGEHKIRELESPLARELLRFALRILGLARRSEFDDKLVVCGRDGFWGRQFRMLDKLNAFEFDCRRVQLELSRELAGRKPPADWEVRRAYLPTVNAQGRNQAGGLAQRHDRSVRTIGRWARLARAAGLFRTSQPTRSSPEAVMPRVGSWSYGEWILLASPCKTLMGKLQKWWGEKRKNPTPKDLGRRAGEPPSPSSSPWATTGPPGERLSALEPPDDLGALLGLSLSELDDFEQLVGLPA